MRRVLVVLLATSFLTGGCPRSDTRTPDRRRPEPRALDPDLIAHIAAEQGQPVTEPVKSLDTFARRPAHETIDFIAFRKEQFGKIRTVLARDPSDERFLRQSSVLSACGVPIVSEQPPLSPSSMHRASALPLSIALTRLRSSG